MTVLCACKHAQLISRVLMNAIPYLGYIGCNKKIIHSPSPSWLMVLFGWASGSVDSIAPYCRKPLSAHTPMGHTHNLTLFANSSRAGGSRRPCAAASWLSARPEAKMGACVCLGSWPRANHCMAACRAVQGLPVRGGWFQKSICLEASSACFGFASACSSVAKIGNNRLVIFDCPIIWWGDVKVYVQYWCL